MRIRDSLGVHTSHVEARTPTEQIEALRTYAAQGYHLVFAHGFEFQDPAERVASQYPHTVFIITSGRRAVGNVAPLIFRLEEASYLAGMVAGGLSRSHVLGFVGGIELPPIEAAGPGSGRIALVVPPSSGRTVPWRFASVTRSSSVRLSWARMSTAFSRAWTLLSRSSAAATRPASRV